LDWDGWTAYEQQISIWVASGVAPDVVLIPYYALPALVESDALLPVDDLIERDGAGFGYDDFVSVAKQATQWDQKTWGLPYDLSLWWNNYNADAFADAGTADPGQLLDAGNWTWDAMITAAHKLTQTAPDGSTKQWGLLTFAGDGGIYPWLWGYGGALLSADHSRAEVASAASVEGLTNLHDLIYKEKVLTFPVWSGIPVAAPDGTMAQGRGVMQLWWSNLIGDYTQPGATWHADQAPLPPGPASPFTGPAQIHTVAVMKQSKNVQAAWTFAKFITGKEAYAQAMKESPGFVPVRQSLLSTYSAIEAQSGVRGTRFFNQGLAGTRLLPRAVQMAKIESLKSSLLGRVWKDQAAAKGQAEELARQIDLLLGAKS
ncbi:MAG TPA: extracellular solute-binding protein, partial [Limnochordia bacterium]|nr:extracellular solute-binding protein [Limnochordia bacterium]